MTNERSGGGGRRGEERKGGGERGGQGISLAYSGKEHDKQREMRGKRDAERTKTRKMSAKK